MTKLLIPLLLIISSMVTAQDGAKKFHELYFGTEFGSSYMFGGAQVDNIETIGDGNVPVLGGTIGWQKTSKTNISFGVEFQINKPFGSFENTENPDGTIVMYEIKPQSALQFNLGYNFGTNRQHSVFGYFAFNQTRFNIDISRPSGNFKQTDFENYGKVGAGYEYHFNEAFSGRLYAGSSMDALPNTENGIDFRASLLYSLRKYSK